MNRRQLVQILGSTAVTLGGASLPAVAVIRKHGKTDTAAGLQGCALEEYPDIETVD